MAWIRSVTAHILTSLRFLNGLPHNYYGLSQQPLIMIVLGVIHRSKMLHGMQIDVSKESEAVRPEMFDL